MVEPRSRARTGAAARTGTRDRTGSGRRAGSLVGVLGPVLMRVDGTELPVGSPQQQAVLAVLVLAEGRHVSLDAIVDGLWGDAPPRSAPTTVRTYVSRLRATTAAHPGAPRIAPTAGGYLLDLAGARTDLAEFRALVSDAGRHRDAGRLDEAAAASARALALWRGPALGGVPGPAAEAQRRRLEALRDAAVEDALADDLDRGAVDGPLAELEVLVRDQPLRERLWELRMRALWVAGRTAEALGAFHEARQVLDDELAVEPGPGLRSLHERILAAEPPDRRGAPGAEPPSAPAPAAALPRPNQLPAPPAGFTGRGSETAQLDEAASDRSAPSVVVISGLPGAGKTTLALRWAHTVERDFADGSLYADLRGFAPGGRPTAPADVARWFAEALGADPGSMPADPDAIVSRYRTLVAGRDVLVVLDNARDADQVRPLLPGTAGPVAVVTSRNPLAGLVASHGARHVRVDVLDADDARRLLSRRLGPARVDAEPAAVDELVQRSGGLPLALAVLAARAALHPGATLEAVVAELRTRAPALDAYASVDPATDVRAVLSWSMHGLVADAERLLRAVALHPGSELTRAAAASAAGLDLAAAEPALQALVETQLVLEPRPGRFAQHDLVRAFARERAAPGEEREVLTRVLHHQALTAERVSALLAPQRARPPAPSAPDGVTAEPLSTAEDATGWFEAERPNLRPVLTAAYEQGFDVEVIRVARALQVPQDLRNRWGSWIATNGLALRGARRQGDRAAEALALHSLGVGYDRTGRPVEAGEHWRQAAELFRELGDDTRLANALIGLAAVAADRAAAERMLGEAAQLARGAGSTIGEATALNNLALDIADDLGRGAEALGLLDRAHEVYLDGGDLRLAAVARTNRAWVALALEHDGTAAAFREAAAVFAEHGDVLHEAEALIGLGTALHRDGLPSAGTWARAAALFPDDLASDPDARQLRARLTELVEDPARAWTPFVPGGPRGDGAAGQREAGGS